MPMEITANLAGAGLVRIEIDGCEIRSLSPAGPFKPKEPYISPGFVDIQINGFAGVDFSSPELDAQSAVDVLPSIWRTGVTTFCATLITSPIELLERNVRVLEEARRLSTAFNATIPCYHLEGPYLSPGGAHGAHNPRLMRLPDWDEFSRLQEAAGGNIGIVTIAPELPGAMNFIRHARNAGLIMALGHTDGGPLDIHKAVEAGATVSTHLGNGCPTHIHRHLNPIWAQIANDELSASLICDGFHLPPDLVQTIYKAKGIGRCILVTDAVFVAELSAGVYSLVDSEIELLPSGQVVTADRHSMAGSALAMNKAIAMFRKFTEITLHQALEAAVTNPGRLLGRSGICTELAVGQPANLTIFRPHADSLEIERVLVQGTVVYERKSGGC